MENQLKVRQPDKMEANINSISFIIPAFNCTQTLKESVESIYHGNFEDGDEVIIVDDASTDDTYNEALKLQKKHPSIHIYAHKFNKGSAAAGRNTAIEKARNELLFCLDADNILVKGSIGKLKKFFLEKKADAASFQEIHFFINKIEEVTHKRIYPAGEIRLREALAGDIWPGPSGNYMFTKTNWLKCGRYHEFVGGAIDSWAFGMKQLIENSKMMVMPDSHYLHRYGYESTYVRDERKGNLSLMALQIILPILHLIDDKDVDFVLSKKGRTTWFQNLQLRPLKLKDGEIGKVGEIVRINNEVIANEVQINRVRMYVRSLVSLIVRKLKSLLKNSNQKEGNEDVLNFRNEFNSFKEKDKSLRIPINWQDRFPCLNDKTKTTQFDAHYVYHPAWAARIISKINPEIHIDISSTLHFCSILSAFVPVRFYDYRPANLALDNLESGNADLTNLFFKDNSISSISCMHTVEHIGLGRYGDPLDPEGDLKAINELKRVCMPGGNILFVVPVGKPLLRFNAHRIYSPQMIVAYFSGFELLDFSLVTDGGTFLSSCELKVGNEQVYGCGCFWFKKTNDISQVTGRSW